MNLAVIPARGGSKRIPRKNIKPFCGQPMIAWSIKAAIDSGCFDRIVVSTDDDEIASVAEALGAEVPFLRPAELSDDYSGTMPVVAHAIRELSKDCAPHYVCCLYATAPFARSEDIVSAQRRLSESPDCDFAFTVTSYPFPIQRALKKTNTGRLEMFWPEHFKTRSQDLEEAWHDAGQFYWGKTDAWLESRPLFASRSLPIALPRHRVQDIDTEEDWTRAEWMFRALKDVDDRCPE